MAEEGPERLELGQMSDCVIRVFTERGVQWSSGTPEVVWNEGRRSRLFILAVSDGTLPDDHFWITETCQETGAPATISADDFEVRIHTMNELKADVEYYLSAEEELNHSQ